MYPGNDCGILICPVGQTLSIVVVYPGRITRLQQTIRTLPHGRNALLISIVSHGVVGRNDVCTSLLEKLLYSRLQAALWTHLLFDLLRPHLGRLDLKSNGSPAQPRPVWQRIISTKLHPNINAAIRLPLIASPSHTRSRQPLFEQRCLTQTRHQFPKLIIFQGCYVFRAHLEQRRPHPPRVRGTHPGYFPIALGSAGCSFLVFAFGAHREKLYPWALYFPIQCWSDAAPTPNPTVRIGRQQMQGPFVTLTVTPAAPSSPYPAWPRAPRPAAPCADAHRSWPSEAARLAG